MNPGARSPVRQPVLFFGHGSPMNAIEDNPWSRGFRAIGSSLSRPRAILSVSAHWYLPGVFLTGDEMPRTIHDFGGFPRELFQLSYPAPGSMELATRVAELLAADEAEVTLDWGLDHGTWTVLRYLFPKADVPVVQLSIDSRLPPAAHLALGKKLAPLRADGVLVMGSGNVVHNLGYALRADLRGDRSTPTWAAWFDDEVKKAVAQGDGDRLAHLVDSEDGRLSHPTLDHYLPLLYAVGAAGESEQISFPIEGFDLGSLSMRSIHFS
ncbi:MAG: 4,5-DOPA dioxygenase extradiol [Myxococcales bacterium]|nr:4,5-DOPA dioxygenase extradiol [Myxococcales bacterium]